jgi:hypothetical protein
MARANWAGRPERGSSRNRLMSIIKCGGIPAGFGFIPMASCSPISLQIATLWRRLTSTSPRCAQWVKYPMRRRGKPIRRDRHYRRAVTRRASRIFAPESAFRKQGAAKSGQTCVEQFEAAARTSSRSPLASTATSSVCTLGANPGKAITDAPRNASTARADSDLTIWGC